MFQFFCTQEQWSSRHTKDAIILVLVPSIFPIRFENYNFCKETAFLIQDSFPSEIPLDLNRTETLRYLNSCFSIIEDDKKWPLKAFSFPDNLLISKLCSKS